MLAATRYVLFSKLKYGHYSVLKYFYSMYLNKFVFFKIKYNLYLYKTNKKFESTDGLNMTHDSTRDNCNCTIVDYKNLNN